MNQISPIQLPNAPTKADLDIVGHYADHHRESPHSFQLTNIPEAADRERLCDALTACMVPPTDRQMAEVIATIAASWPHAGQKIESSAMDLHIRFLVEDLAEFPHDALLAAVRDLRRSSVFMPSIAELRKAANKIVWVRAWALKTLERQPGAGARYCATHKPHRPEYMQRSF